MIRRLLAYVRSSYIGILVVPYIILFFGLASNQLVLLANNDTFPVRVNLLKVYNMTDGDPVILPDGTIILGHKIRNKVGVVIGISDDTHCLMTENTHLNFLADNFDFHESEIVSIGDILIDLGHWVNSFIVFIWIGLIIPQLGNNEKQT